MVVTLTPPAPQDENEEIKRIIRATIEEVKLRLPFLQEWSETSLFQLASSVLWEERTRRGFGLADPLHTRWSHLLAQNALSYWPTWETQSTASGVSYAPILLGEDEEHDDTFYLRYEDRAAGGVYILGLPGVGKSTILEHIGIGDIKNGHSVIYVVTNWEMISRIAAQIPESRLHDVLLFDFGLMEHIPSLNLIEPTEAGIEVDIARFTDYIDRWWGYGSAHPSTGPRMINLIEMGSHVLYRHELTIAELLHFYQDREFRTRLVSALDDTGIDYTVKMFWEDFDKQDKRTQREWISPVQNKLYKLMRSRHMLLMLGQKKTTLKPREWMDNNKIVLIYLDKSQVGSMENVGLIGTALIGEIMRSAFSRNPADPNNKYCSLIVDEFENFVSSEWEEAIPLLRKYKLNVVLANQVYAQLGEKLQGIVGGMGCQITFPCSSDDAQRPPEPLYREQPKRVPVQKPLSDVLFGKQSHGNASVLALFQEWEKEYTISRQDPQIHELDRYFYAVMAKDTQVLQGSFPWYLLTKHIQTLLARTPLQSKYASLFWEFHNKQVEAAKQEPKNTEAQKELERVNLRLYNLLFSSEEEFWRLFIEWMKEAYEQIQEEILCVCETLLYGNFNYAHYIGFSSLPLLKSPSCFTGEQQMHEAMRTTPRYLTEKRELIERTLDGIAQSAKYTLGFSIDYTRLEEILKSLQWTVTYENTGKYDPRTDEEKQAWEAQYGSRYNWIASKVLLKCKESSPPFLTGYVEASPYDYGEGVFYHAHWCRDKYTLSPGQETALLPLIEPEVKRAFNEAKPIFVQAIRFLREVFQALAQTPITQQTSEMEQVAYGTKPTSEMRMQMAQELVNLQKYHCFVRLGASDTAAKPLIHVRRPGKGVEGQELEARIAAIRENTKQYGTAPSVIEQELDERRAALGIKGNTPVKAKDTAKKEAGPDTRKEAAPVKASRPSGKTAPDSSPAATSVLVFDEDFPTLLYHWHYLSLGQIKRLLRKKPGDTHVAERMKKYVSDGLIAETEYKEPGKPGKPQRIYSLTDTGLRFLEKTRGLTSGSRNMPFSTHTLLANDMLIALALLPAFAPDYTLSAFTHERTYKSKAIALSQGGVEPDGTLTYLYQGQPLTLVCELDLDSENKVQWQAKCEKYIEALNSGLFGPDRVVIAVCQPGGEIKNLLAWTSEILEDHKDLAPLFHFSSVSPEKMAPLDFVTGSHWRKPFCTDAAALLEITL